MPIKFRCVHCGQYLGISRSKAGTIVDCPTCGRSVGVPQKDGQADRVDRPSLNHQDSELAEALREVAAIAQSSESALPQNPPKREHAGDARETREVHAPPPKVVPAAPLAPARPIDPETMPGGGFLPPDAFGSDSMDDDEETYYERVPLKSLESLATAEPQQMAGAPQSKQTSIVAFPWTNELPWKLWLAFIAVGFVSILAGFALGRWDRGQATAKQAENENQPESSAKSEPETIDGYADLLADYGDVSFVGTVTYAEGDGSPIQKDAGAWVYAFPVERKGTGRIPADWLKAANSSVGGSDRALCIAALRAMGGNAVQAKGDGSFQLHLPQAGQYHLLVCSANVRRSPEPSVAHEIVEMLAEFVDDHDAFLDQRQYAYIAPITCDSEKTPVAIDPLTP